MASTTIAWRTQVNNAGSQSPAQIHHSRASGGKTQPTFQHMPGGIRPTGGRGPSSWPLQTVPFTGMCLWAQPGRARAPPQGGLSRARVTFAQAPGDVLGAAPATVLRHGTLLLKEASPLMNLWPHRAWPGPWGTRLTGCFLPNAPSHDVHFLLRPPVLGSPYTCTERAPPPLLITVGIPEGDFQRAFETSGQNDSRSTEVCPGLEGVSKLQTLSVKRVSFPGAGIGSDGARWGRTQFLS